MEVKIISNLGDYEVIKPVFISDKIDTNFFSICRTGNIILIFFRFKDKQSLFSSEKILELPEKYKFKGTITILNEKNFGVTSVKDKSHLVVANGSALYTQFSYISLTLPIYLFKA